MPFTEDGQSSDTPTSSSGNESIESSTSASFARFQHQNPSIQLPDPPEAESDTDSEPSSPPRSRWEAETPPVVPHRILKLRRLLFDAFHSALTILWETKPHAVTPAEGASGRPKRKGEEPSVKLDVREPWMRLSRTIGALKSAPAGSSDDRVSGLCMVVIQTIMLQGLLPLTSDKQYIRTLARNEAKAIPSLLKSWSKISSINVADLLPEAPISEDAWIDALDSAPIVILRLAHHALLGTHRDRLDLSSLGITPTALDPLNVPALCDALGAKQEEVKELDMSSNGWKRLPAWLPFPFPSITSLDLTNNTPLTHLPISLTSLPIAKVHIRGTQLADTQAPLIRSTRLTPSAGDILGSAAPLVPPTLLHILLRLYNTDIRRHHPPTTLTELPPQILHLVSETYACELCLEYQYPDTSRWQPREVERGWMVVEAERKVVRVKGRVCRACEEVYLRPVLASP